MRLLTFASVGVVAMGSIDLEDMDPLIEGSTKPPKVSIGKKVKTVARSVLDLLIEGIPGQPPVLIPSIIY